MKNIKLIFSFVLLLAVTISCSIPDGIDQDTSFLSSATSGNVSKIFDISTDNSGIVKITPTGDGVTSFTVKYGHGTGAAASAVVAPGGNTSHVYPEGSYTVSIVSTNIAGVESTATFPLVVTYRAPVNVTIETSGEMKVKASALYAKSFLVYYGDVANEVGKPMAIGQELPAHTYPATGGPFVLKVEALSGGVAKTTATKTLFDLPIDFEIADVDFFGTFDDWGQQLFETVDNPSKTGINTSLKVGKYTNGHASWSGTYSPLNIPINLAYGKKIKVMVYNPDAANIGKKINVELEAAVGGTPANGVGILKMPITTSGAWEEIIFDFSSISALPTGAKFSQLVLRFNDSQNGTQEVFYVDNITLTN